YATTTTIISIHSFFFSSRRRHTRFSRDWSSDVCSSDLRTARDRLGRGGHRGHHRALPQQRGGVPLVLPAQLEADRRLGRYAAERSEERRGGKECRCRWGREDSLE